MIIKVKFRSLLWRTVLLALLSSPALAQITASLTNNAAERLSGTDPKASSKPSDGEVPVQSGENASPKQIIIVTGARFTYPLVQKWIDDYARINSDVQVVIESRGSSDPPNYEILTEVFEHDEQVQRNREYLYVARYAVLPVANAASDFARTYSSRGLDKNLIRQLYFRDLFADQSNEQVIKTPYTVYTRLQKAGAPMVFTHYFGFEQKDIHGKAIAGADEHLLKAVLRDSLAISYLPLTLIYDHKSRKPVDGLTVLPVDLNNNGKVSEDEKFYDDLDAVMQKLDQIPAKDMNNVPIEYLHLSVDKRKASPEAIEFLRWVMYNGENDLRDFGYLKPESSRFDKGRFEQFASKSLK